MEIRKNRDPCSVGRVDAMHLNITDISGIFDIFEVVQNVFEILVFQQSGGGFFRHRRPGWLVFVVVVQNA